jgi:hypothetical protein
MASLRQTKFFSLPYHLSFVIDVAAKRIFICSSLKILFMQTKNQLRLATALFTLGMFTLTLFSSSFRPGADHYEIYLNKKLVLQQYVTQSAAIKSVALDQRNQNDQIDVFYSHCGQLGAKRTITIKDGKAVLKQWSFSDGADNKFMSVGAKDILAFQNKNSDRKLSLYYSSKELPEGRLLASVILNTDVIKAQP